MKMQDFVEGKKERSNIDERLFEKENKQRKWIPDMMQFFEEAELCMGKESRSKSLSLLQ